MMPILSRTCGNSMALWQHRQSYNIEAFFSHAMKDFIKNSGDGDKWGRMVDRKGREV